MKAFFSSIFLLIISYSAFAEEFNQPNVNIKRLGSHTGYTFYMSIDDALKTDCPYNFLYCRLDDENCKNYLTIALTAKATKTKLRDLRYQTGTPSGHCEISLIAIE